MSEKGVLSPRAFLSVWTTERVRDGSVSEDLMGPRASDVTKSDGSVANWGLYDTGLSPSGFYSLPQNIMLKDKFD